MIVTTGAAQLLIERRYPQDPKIAPTYTSLNGKICIAQQGVMALWNFDRVM